MKKLILKFNGENKLTKEQMKGIMGGTEDGESVRDYYCFCGDGIIHFCYTHVTQIWASDRCVSDCSAACYTPGSVVPDLFVGCGVGAP